MKKYFETVFVDWAMKEENIRMLLSSNGKVARGSKKKLKELACPLVGVVTENMPHVQSDILISRGSDVWVLTDLHIMENMRKEREIEKTDDNDVKLLREIWEGNGNIFRKRILLPEFCYSLQSYRETIKEKTATMNRNFSRDERLPEIDKRREKQRAKEKIEYEKEIEKNLLGDLRFSKIFRKMIAISGIDIIRAAEVCDIVARKANGIVNVPNKSKMKGLFGQYISKEGVSVYRRAAKDNDGENGWKKNYHDRDKTIIWGIGNSLISLSSPDPYYRAKYDDYKARQHEKEYGKGEMVKFNRKNKPGERRYKNSYTEKDVRPIDGQINDRAYKHIGQKFINWVWKEWRLIEGLEI